METASGRVVIPGDEVYLYANLEDDIPIGYYPDFERVARATDLLHEIGGQPVRAHDAEVMRRHPSAVVG